MEAIKEYIEMNTEHLRTGGFLDENFDASKMNDQLFRRKGKN